MGLLKSPWSCRHQVVHRAGHSIFISRTTIDSYPAHLHLRFLLEPPTLSSAVPSGAPSAVLYVVHDFPPMHPLFGTCSNRLLYRSGPPYCLSPSLRCCYAHCHSLRRRDFDFPRRFHLHLHLRLHLRFRFHLHLRLRPRASWSLWLGDAVGPCSRSGCADPNDVRDL